ncbi:50S ribosomal protein L9 [Aquibaculum sediminis]|uniref:50S ribosomal protein L9 n=1 Tax=Aquibaculum sediminis TaxID=3231907 RepID=UPI003453D0CB
MEVILLERIENLGQMGDVVRVKPGFARNYLLPQHKALRSNKENLAIFEQRRAQLEAENLKRRQEAEAVAKKIDGLSVVIIRQAGDSGQLYGSVASRDIAEAVTAAGTSINRNQVVLDRPIKMLGLHDLRLRLHPEVSVPVSINVARSETEAEMQAESGRYISADEMIDAEEAAEAEALAAAEAAEAAEAEAAGETESDEETA